MGCCETNNTGSLAKASDPVFVCSLLVYGALAWRLCRARQSRTAATRRLLLLANWAAVQKASVQPPVKFGKGGTVIAQCKK